MSSFVADKIVMDGLTYDDVLLIPAYSEVLPKQVELKTKFSRNIELNVPFVTAAMDTVTEASMAIAIAREGGIGVIHKNMTIEEQARQVAIVKRAENGMIYDPVTIRRGSTVKDALDMMHDYHIGGIPVVDDENHLVGIVTNRDLRFERHMDKKIDEVMTSENLVTTHIQTDLVAAAAILQENKIEKLPVVDNENHLVGLITYKDITKAKDKPMACKDAKGRLRVAAGVGVTVDTLDRAKALVEAGADAIVIDTAHGHSKGVVEKLKQVKAAFPQVDVVVGNVATGFQNAKKHGLFEECCGYACMNWYKEWYLKQNTTGIKQTETQADVVSTLYYNIEGKEVDKPTAGVYIIKQLLSNGKIRSRKVFLK